MKRRVTALALLLAVAACSDSLQEPELVDTPVMLSEVGAADGPNAHLMQYADYDVADLAAAVAQMGGTLTSYSEIGFGTVTGLTDAQVAALASGPDVLAAAPDPAIDWTDEPMGEQFTTEMVDQSGAFFFDRFQWYLRQIDADDAWAVTSGGAGTTVAVLDTGVDPFHIDLSGKIDLAASASMITPGTSPCGPFDEGSIFDLNFHGTFVSALVSSNGLGMGSVAPAADIMGVKVLNCTGSGSFGDLIAGIIHATSEGADVINMSLGALVLRSQSRPLIDALEAAVDFARDAGVTLVAASGNDGIDFKEQPNDLRHIPSMIKGVISVGATAPTQQQDFDALTDYTNFGQRAADIMAPGGRSGTGVIEDFMFSACSTFVCGGSAFYVLSTGTSFASPLAAGAAASAIAEGEDAEKCLTKGADRITGRGNDHQYSRGRLNVLGTVGCKRLKAD